MKASAPNAGAFLSGQPRHAISRGSAIRPIALTASRNSVVTCRSNNAVNNKWYDDASRAHHDTVRKFLPQPLAAKPLVAIDATLTRFGSEPHAYISPSPAHMMWRAQSLALDEARALLATNPHMNGAIGSAIGRYLHDLLVSICGEASVINLDDVFGPRGPPHADFAIVVGSTAIIVESKTTFGNAMGKSVVSPADYVSSWDRIWSAYLQCAATIRATEFKTHPAFSSVVDFIHLATFEEHLCVESGALNAVAVREGLFARAQFACAEALTLQELEDALVIHGPARLAAEVGFKWHSRRQDEPLGLYLRTRPTPTQPFSDRRYAEPSHAGLFRSNGVLDAIRARDCAICVERSGK